MEVNLGNNYFRVEGEADSEYRTYQIRYFWKTVTFNVAPQSIIRVNGFFGNTSIFKRGTLGYDVTLADLNAREDGIWRNDQDWIRLAVMWKDWVKEGRPDAMGGWMVLSDEQKQAFLEYEKYSPMTC